MRHARDFAARAIAESTRAGIMSVLMTTYVLIHGAGDVGWYWHLLEAELRTRGHDTVTPDFPCEDDAAGVPGIRPRWSDGNRRAPASRRRRAVARLLHRARWYVTRCPRISSSCSRR